MLERAAAAFEAQRDYEPARTLLETAAAIRAAQGADSGLAFIKLGDLESRRNHPADAEEFYRKAIAVMGDRAEAAPALLYLGVTSLRKNETAQALDHFQKAERLDPAMAGRARMWMALVREREQNNAEAEILYKSALQLEAPDSGYKENIKLLYARFLRNQGREDEAKLIDGAQQLQAAIRTLNAYRVGGGVTAPAVIYKVDPDYREEARAARFSGTVVLYVEISPDGAPLNIQVKKGLGFGLDENAIDAVSRWRFKPGMKDNLPVAVAANIEVNFRLL